MTNTANRIAAAKWYLNNFDVPGFTRDVEANEDDVEAFVIDGAPFHGGGISDMYGELANFAYANFYVAFGHVATEARNGADWARERCDAILAQVNGWLVPYAERLCELIAKADTTTPEGDNLRSGALPAGARIIERD